MTMIDKQAFDASIEKAAPLECVALCNNAVSAVYAGSESLGGRKWQFSKLRTGWTDTGREHVPPRGSLTRDAYTVEVGAAVIRLVKTVPARVVKAMVVQALVRLDSDDSQAYKSETRDAVVKDLDPTRGRRAILSVDGFISLGESLLTANSYYERILGLCALTGRRGIEIATSAIFERIDANSVLFTGQAKTRGRPAAPYAIPTLTNSIRVIDALATIRDDCPELVLKPELFHNRTSRELGRRSRVFSRCFSNNDARPKDLRAAYAEICWLVMDERETGKALYLSRVLGHGDNDLLTAQSYDDFTITDPAYN